MSDIEEETCVCPQNYRLSSTVFGQFENEADE